MPDVVYFELFTYIPLHTPEGLARLLDAVTQVPELLPSQWGPDTRARNSFNRDEMIAEVSDYKSELYSPGLQRRQPPAYDAYFSAKSGGINTVHFEFKKPRAKDEQAIFSLGDALADALQPELGFVHPIWRLGEERSGLQRGRDTFFEGTANLWAESCLRTHLVWAAAARANRRGFAGIIRFIRCRHFLGRRPAGFDDAALAWRLCHAQPASG